MFYIIEKEGKLEIVDYSDFQKSMGLVNTPIMSMTQLENLEDFEKLQGDLFELRMRFDFILGNIQEFETDPMLIHTRVSNLLQEYQTRLDALMEMKEKTPTFGIKRLADGTARWFGWVTNRWEDREKDILAEKSHIEFKEYLDETGFLPVLLKRHDFSTEHTNTPDWYDYSEGFFMYSGILTEKEADAVEEYQKEVGEPLGMSHRFIGWPSNKKEQDGYRQFDIYRSFEVSYLPLSKAANPYTGFILEEKGTDMNFSQQLQKDLGEELLAQIRNKTIGAREALERKGINTKEYLEKHADILPESHRARAEELIEADTKKEAVVVADTIVEEVETDEVETPEVETPEVTEALETPEVEVPSVDETVTGISFADFEALMSKSMDKLKVNLTTHFEENLVVNASKELKLEEITSSVAKLTESIEAINEKLTLVDGLKGDVEKLMETDEKKTLNAFFDTMDFTASPNELVKDDVLPEEGLKEKSDNRFDGMAEMFGGNIFNTQG